MRGCRSSDRPLIGALSGGEIARAVPHLDTLSGETCARRRATVTLGSPEVEAEWVWWLSRSSKPEGLPKAGRWVRFPHASASSPHSPCSAKGSRWQGVSDASRAPTPHWQEASCCLGGDTPFAEEEEDEERYQAYYRNSFDMDWIYLP